MVAEGLDSEMGRLFIYHIQCRHYEFHLKDSGVELVDVCLLYLFSPTRSTNAAFLQGKLVSRD
jgi:hypothetical protein